MVTELIKLKYKISHTPVMVNADSILLPTDNKNILVLNPDLGAGSVERIQLTPGLSIQITKFESFIPVEISRDGTMDDELFIMDFHLKGSGSIDLVKFEEAKLERNQFHYGAYFATSNIQSKGIFQENSSNEQIHIVIDKNWLFEEFSEILKDVFHKVKLTGAFFIFERLNASLIEVVHDIITSNPKSDFRKSYLKGKTLELLTLFFQELNKRSEHQPFDEINSIDIARLFTLESFIKDNLKFDLSVVNLSNHIGFSESKLQKLFKHVYGKSVHKKINEIKMIKALELLEEKELSISQIGYEMGYRNMSHFSAAFKRMHGFLPSEY